MSSGCGCKEVYIYRFPHITLLVSALLLYLFFFVAASLIFYLYFSFLSI